MGALKEFILGLKAGAKEEFARQMADAGDKGGKAAKTGVEKAVEGVKEKFKEIAAALGLAFGIKEVINFAKESIKAAAESEQAWSTLRVTMGNLGIDFGKRQKEIEGVAQAIQNSTRFSDESVLRGFNTLLTMTGQYSASLKALGPIADFAAAAHLSFEDASRLVGRAVEGNVKGLRLYIPELQKGDDVIAKITSRFSGQSAADFKTFAGSVAYLKNMYDELHEAVGQVLIQGGEESSVMSTIGDAVKGATEWVKENKEQLAGIAKVLADFLLEGLKRFFGLIAGGIEDIKNLARFVDLVKLSFVDLQVTFLKLDEAWTRAAAKFAEFIGKRDQAGMLTAQANQMRSEIDRLEAYAKEKRKPLSEQIAGGFTDAEKPIDTSTKKSGKALKDNLGGAAFDSANKVKDLSDAVKRHMADMSAAFNNTGKDFETGYTGSILRGKNEVLKAYKEMQDGIDANKHTTEELRQANETLMKEYVGQQVPDFLAGQKAQADAWHEQRDAVQEWADKVHSGNEYFTQTYVPDVLKGSRTIIDDAHEQAAAAEGVEDAFRGGEQYYVNTAVPNILEGQGKVKQGMKDQTKTSGEEKDKQKKHYADIRATIDDVATGIKGVIDTLGLGDTAVGRLATGFINLAQKAGNFVAAIASGNWLSALAQGLGLATDIVKAIGGRGEAGQRRHDMIAQYAAQLHSGDPDIVASGLRQLRAIIHDPVKELGLDPNDLLNIQAAQVEAIKAVRSIGETYHMGGTVGPMGRIPLTGIWADAPRMHTGGYLRPDERPIVAKVGETILPAGVPPMNLSVNLYGVNGNNLPQKVVSAVNEAMARQYQTAATLQGNSRM